MDDPLQIVPFGRTAEQQAKLDARQGRAKKAIRCCALQLIIVLILIIAACEVTSRVITR